MCRGTRVYKLYENETRSAIRESVYDEAQNKDCIKAVKQKVFYALDEDDACKNKNESYCNDTTYNEGEDIKERIGLNGAIKEKKV